MLIGCCRYVIRLEKHRRVRFVSTHFATNFPLLGRKPSHRQRCFLPLLNYAGPVAIVVVEVLAAQRDSPLVVDLVVGITRNTLPLGPAAARGRVVLVTVVVVEDERQLIGCVKGSDD